MRFEQKVQYVKTRMDTSAVQLVRWYLGQEGYYPVRGKTVTGLELIEVRRSNDHSKACDCKAELFDSIA